jgi:signal transduction histidine kinase
MMERVFVDPSAGMGFAAGCLLVLLALGFFVAHGLRPRWGMLWVASAMGLAAFRALISALGLGGSIWPELAALLAAATLSALLVGLQTFVVRPPRHPLLNFLLGIVAWFALRELLSRAGVGAMAAPLASSLVFAYLALLCTGRLQSVAGRAYPIAVVALMANPVLVLGVGVLLLELDLVRLRGWSALGMAGVGLGLMMAGMGRLRLELESELKRRREAEAELRGLNDSLEQRVQHRTAELEQLVNGLESFNRMVSHDLRGPLGGLRGLADLTLLALRNKEEDKVEKYLGRMRDETHRLGTLVSQLLQLARITHADLAIADTALDEVLDDALQTLALSEGESAVACVRAEPLPRAQVDAALLRQVFVNLIGNAMKFAGATGKPDVYVHPSDGSEQIVVEVRDNGPGFPPERASELFQPFRRLHGREFEGSGIGLTIVRRIVERHGGMVWAEGRPGQGASFFFSLPRPS